MSRANFAAAFAPAEARHKEAVMQHTWGHLAPGRNRKYKGHILFAVGCYADDRLNPTTLECELGDLDDSPWFFEALQDFLQSLKLKTGGVYRFDGWFRNYKFVGTLTRLALAPVEESTRKVEFVCPGES